MILQIYGTDCLLNLVVYTPPSLQPPCLFIPLLPWSLQAVCPKGNTPGWRQVVGTEIRNVSLFLVLDVCRERKKYVVTHVRMRLCACSLCFVCSMCVLMCKPCSHLCVCVSAGCVFLSVQLSITSPHSSPANPVNLVPVGVAGPQIQHSQMPSLAHSLRHNLCEIQFLQNELCLL